MSITAADAGLASRTFGVQRAGQRAARVAGLRSPQPAASATRQAAASNDTVQGRAKNRRVVVDIVENR
jgi:flagellar motor protein MotB